MTDKPINVRLAVKGDEDPLYQLLYSKLYTENGAFSASPRKTMETICNATEGKGGIIGIIDGNNEIAGTIGMRLDQYWYTDDWYVAELWNFVHPDYRASDYAKNLIDFAKWVAEEMRLPLNIGIISTHRTEAKVRLYRRRLTPVGEFFMHNLEVTHGPAIEKHSHQE